MPASLKAYFPLALSCLETVALRLMAMKWKKSDMEKMMKLWDESFKEPLFPECREVSKNFSTDF